MSAAPRFLRRYRRVVARNPSPETFSDYLERLDAYDWKEVVEALLITRSAAIYEVITPEPGTDLIDAAARLFEQASPASMRHYTAALDAVLSSVLGRLEDERDVEILASGLALMEMLPDFSNPDLPRAIAFNQSLPPDLRVTAALAIAERDDAHVDWKSVDLVEAPFLLPPVICGLTCKAPRTVIHTIVATQRPPYNAEMLRYPLRLAIRRLIHIEGADRAEELLETIPLHHWSRSVVFKQVLSASEFSAFRDHVAAQRISAENADDDRSWINALARSAIDVANNVWKGSSIKDLRARLSDVGIGARMEQYLNRLREGLA